MLRIELDDELERKLFATLLGSITGGGRTMPLHINPDLLDGKDREIRRFVDKLYDQIQRGGLS